MSFQRAAARSASVDALELTERLRSEFERPNPAENVQPIIRAEPPEPAPISRLFVIWDDWAHLDQQERSEIIMDAYTKAMGQQDSLKIAVAMGLTSLDAGRMGIR